ncbi:unnamed protein product [Fraxinus pennsylvanica]|uniref:Uncharacterized protein n=1 Tax=Fraxinus pennsylvanica TaxID=56036 RepID=A0AAD1ZT61_9LAMI|nr:unnamed protein product [Fraxinus pennsylvanica]
MPHHHDHTGSASDLEDQKIRHMRRALDSLDVELVKLMVMGEGLNLDKALALHYAVENCSREVVKALLELGATDVNYAINYGKRSKLEFTVCALFTILWRLEQSILQYYIVAINYGKKDKVMKFLGG